MAAVAGYQSNILISTNASSVALPANDVLTDSGDHTTYTEAIASHRYWDPTAVPTVQIDTVGDGAHYATAAPTTYTVQYVGGKVIFNVANSAITLVRVSTGGKYFAYTTYALGTDWELNGVRDLADVTVFVGNGGSRAKLYLPTLFTGTFIMKGFWIDNTFQNNLSTGFLLIFSGVMPNGTNRYEAYAYTKDDKVKIPIMGAVEEDMTFQVSGSWYYN